MYPMSACRGKPSAARVRRWLLPVCWLALSPCAAAELRGLPDFSELAEAAAGAVVNISTVRKSPAMDDEEGPPGGPHGMPWEEFMERFFGRGTPPPSPPAPNASIGSGFILSEDGYVITNHHVVKDVDEIIVKLSDRREITAELVGFDALSDIALLKIEADDLPAVRIGAPDKVKVGQWVLAIGAPFGFEHSVTAGIVSAKGRSLPFGHYVPFIQTDVAINPGNSGGPLFNLDGEVVGVNSQIYTRTGSFSGLSFAVPIDLVVDVVGQLKDKGSVSRGWLGVYIQEVTRGLSESFGLDKPTGALVSRVIKGSPAEEAGFEAGDVVLRFDGKEVSLSSSLTPLVGRTPAGSEVEVEIMRDGKRIRLPVVVGELPERPGSFAEGAPRGDGKRVLGLQLRQLTGAERERPGLEGGGLLVEDAGPGAAREAGIAADDVLVMMNNERFDTVEELAGIIESLTKGRFATLLVVRGEQSRFFAVRIPE